MPDDDGRRRRAPRSRRHPRVTLCYRRPRRAPDWPFNLFCMVHARTREEALAVIDELNMPPRPRSDHAVLFSTRCFKQRGARFSRAQRRNALKPIADPTERAIVNGLAGRLSAHRSGRFATPA